MDASASDRLTRRDYFLLVVVCLIFFGLHRAVESTLNVHETVHCQNTREMLADGDWIIPHYGARPWLERPPLPFWITAGFVAVLGDHDWSYLLPPMILGTAIVLLTAQMAAGWFGRNVGFVTGAIMATCQEFLTYATGPEADIFLYFLITVATALFVRIEFGPSAIDDRRFFGRRPMRVLALFVTLGLTNLTKGLAFGTVLALLPMVGFLIADRLRSLRRYVWCWGWLAFLAVAVPWPVLVYLRYPDALDFWRHDYVWRAVAEDAAPTWYYLMVLPWMLLPWTPFAFVGAVKGVGHLLCEAPEGPFRQKVPDPFFRFVLIWAALPIVVLSLSRHKHHHYLLHALAPWTMLAAIGLIRVWERMVQAPRWIPLPTGWRHGPVALAAVLLVLCIGRLVMDFGQHLYFDHYKEDRAFLTKACAYVPAGEPILVDAQDGALTASWWLHYGHGRTRLLHNLTFLRDDRLNPTEVYVIARRHVAPELADYGTAEVVCESRHSRQEKTPNDRYTLFRLRYSPDLARRPGDVRFSPLQATCRVPGPFLD